MARVILTGVAFGLVAWGRDFAYLHLTINNVPLFITELCLALLLCLWAIDVIVSGHGSGIKWTGTLFLLSALLLWTTIAYMRGVIVQPIFATRKFALFYYALFFLPISRWFFQTEQALKLARALYYAGLITTCTRVMNLLGWPSWYDRHLNPSVAMDMAMEWSMLYAMFLFIRRERRWLNLGFILVQLVLIIFCDVRTSWVSMITGSAAFLAISSTYLERTWTIRLALIFPTAIAALFSIHALFPTAEIVASFRKWSRMEVQMVKPQTQQVASAPVTVARAPNAPKVVKPDKKSPAMEAQTLTSQPPQTTSAPAALTRLVNGSKDILQSFIPKKNGWSPKQGNAVWRVRVWTEMTKEVISNHPLVGMGFGVPFLPRVWISEHSTVTEQYPLPNVDPHNSHVAVFYRIGLIGMVLYVGFFASLILASLQTIRNRGVPEIRWSILVVSLSYVVMVLAHSCFAVVLEGPYMGVPFWIAVSLCLTLSCPTAVDESDHDVR